MNLKLGVFFPKKHTDSGEIIAKQFNFIFNLPKIHKIDFSKIIDLLKSLLYIYIKQ